ncbi:MAG: flagellar biosynthesis protein FlhB [Gemmatimonadota bacterium]
MAQSSGDREDRTEAPTQRRLDEASREGRIPRSAELSSAALLLAGTMALSLAGGTTLASYSVTLLHQDGSWLTADPMSINDASSLLGSVVRATLAALAPFLVTVFAVTLLVNVIQARGTFSVEPLGPNWSRLDPVAGIGRLFSIESIFTLIKSVLKLVVLGLTTWMAMRHAWPEIMSLPATGPGVILALMRELSLKVATYTGLVFLAISGVDYAFQLWQHHKSMRMTKQEIIQEHRETDGDPQVKSRIRVLQRQMARKRMLGKVATADVVITNPTHIAVALKYDADVANAPVVLAMGERKLAQRIKQLAYAAGVPVIENRPLAQALLATAKVGAPIPTGLYAAVAEIIAFVYRRRGNALATRGATQ